MKSIVSFCLSAVSLSLQRHDILDFSCCPLSFVLRVTWPICKRVCSLGPFSPLKAKASRLIIPARVISREKQTAGGLISDRWTSRVLHHLLHCGNETTKTAVYTVAILGRSVSSAKRNTTPRSLRSNQWRAPGDLTRSAVCYLSNRPQVSMPIMVTGLSGVQFGL